MILIILLKNILKKSLFKKYKYLKSTPKKFDIVIMNGVHNYNYSLNNKIIRQDIKNLFKTSKKCFIIFIFK